MRIEYQIKIVPLYGATLENQNKPSVHVVSKLNNVLQFNTLLSLLTALHRPYYYFRFAIEPKVKGKPNIAYCKPRPISPLGEYIRREVKVFGRYDIPDLNLLRLRRLRATRSAPTS